MFGWISQTLMQLHLLNIFSLAVSQLLLRIKYYGCCLKADARDTVSSPYTPQRTSQHQQK